MGINAALTALKLFPFTHGTGPAQGICLRASLLWKLLGRVPFYLIP